MAKQVKIETKKKSSDPVADKTANQALLASRSPKTNLVFAVILGLIYLTIFNQSGQQALLYAIGAFLFFNTVDYFILYYRINKRSN
ncbi:MAG: hypothetical protein ACR2FM_02645 [Candidatus Saccharimonadales bacterium]